MGQPPHRIAAHAGRERQGDQPPGLGHNGVSAAMAVALSPSAAGHDQGGTEQIGQLGRHGWAPGGDQAGCLQQGRDHQQTRIAAPGPNRRRSRGGQATHHVQPEAGERRRRLGRLGGRLAGEPRPAVLFGVDHLGRRLVALGDAEEHDEHEDAGEEYEAGARGAQVETPVLVAVL